MEGGRRHVERVAIVEGREGGKKKREIKFNSGRAKYSRKSHSQKESQGWATVAGGDKKMRGWVESVEFGGEERKGSIAWGLGRKRFRQCPGFDGVQTTTHQKCMRTVR